MVRELYYTIHIVCLALNYSNTATLHTLELVKNLNFRHSNQSIFLITDCLYCLKNYLGLPSYNEKFQRYLLFVKKPC